MAAPISLDDDPRSGPLAPLRRRWYAWWDARHPRRERTVLDHGNVYILPTRPGWLFALTLLVLLLASINYQLNLGHLLTFLLAGSAAVSMHMTHRNLRGLALHLNPPHPVHAGQAVMLEAVLDGPDARPRRGVGLQLRHRSRSRAGQMDKTAPHQEPKGDAAWTWADVPPLGQAVVHLTFVAPRRGRLEVPTAQITTRFPFGLFRSWSIWRPAGSVLVYPALEQPAPPLPLAPASGGGAQARRAVAAAEDFEDVRDYRRGDPLRQVAWKKSSRTLQTTGGLVSREREARVQQELWLDWQLAGGLPAEARLSRLAAWVVAADHAGCAYGLRLPGREIAPDLGDAHRRHCLEALALWGHTDGTASATMGSPA